MGKLEASVRHAFHDNGSKRTSGMSPWVDKLHVAPSRRGPDAAVKGVVVQASRAAEPEVQLREWKYGSLERMRASSWCGDRERVIGRL